MCNRYRITAARAAIAARFGVTILPDAETLPQPELFPKRIGWVVRQEIVKDWDRLVKIGDFAPAYLHVPQTAGTLMSRSCTNRR